MKKTYLIAGVFLLSACVGNTRFYEFDGDRIEEGNGGIIMLRKGSLALYNDGLPNKHKCVLRGMLDAKKGEEQTNEQYYSMLLGEAQKHGANIVILNYSPPEEGKGVKLLDPSNLPIYNCEKKQEQELKQTPEPEQE